VPHRFITNLSLTSPRPFVRISRLIEPGATMTTPRKQYLTLLEVATVLGVSRWTVQRLRRRGELKAASLRGVRAVRFDPDEVESYVQRSTRKKG
jgi:excisionase family DNA binding protein